MQSAELSLVQELCMRAGECGGAQANPQLQPATPPRRRQIKAHAKHSSAAAPRRAAPRRIASTSPPLDVAIRSGDEGSRRRSPHFFSNILFLKTTIRAIHDGRGVRRAGERRMGPGGRAARPRRRGGKERKSGFGFFRLQAIDFPRNRQGKSLEILGKSLEKAWKSLEKFGNAWNSWENFARRASARRPRRRVGAPLRARRA